jgi:hypothetical protein
MLDPAKINKKGEGRYIFQWLWMKYRAVSTDFQLEVVDIQVEHDL